MGYPTQKPLALLERIIQASSNDGDVVLDPFCGCGTAIVAAQKLNRKWISIDISHIAVALQKYRLKQNFGLTEKQDYDVIGEPEELSSTEQLFTKAVVNMPSELTTFKKIPSMNNHSQEKIC